MGVPLKNTNYFFLRLLLGPACIVGLLSAMNTSIYTNVSPLLNKFNPFFAYPTAISNTLAITLSRFIKVKTLFIESIVFCTILISGLFAMNSLNVKEINNAEQRLQNDPIYQQKLATYETYCNDVKDSQNSVNKYLDLQMTTDKNWSDGAKSARISRDKYSAKRDSAYADLQTYQTQLTKKGSKNQEAFVAFLSFLPLSENTIKNMNDFIFAVLPDLQICIFGFLLMVLFKDWIAIPTPRGLTRLTWRRLLLTARLLIVHQVFRKSFVDKEKTRDFSSTQIRGVRLIRQLLNEHYPAMTETQIGYLAAQKLGRKLSNGEVDPFSKGYVNKVKNHKLDYLFEE
jgi:hypothetical protein